MIELKKHIIYAKEPLLTALERLNSVPENLTLFVLDDNDLLVGTLTDGDVRRGLIAGKETRDKVEKFMACDFSFLDDHNFSVKEIKGIKKKGVKLLPVLDRNKRIIRVIDFNEVETILPVDTVLMAGGRGERLRPVTDNIPKSLLKVGNKPIIEHNIDRLIKYGVTDFKICVRYLGDKIEEHLGNGTLKGVSIGYVREEEPLGTIGALTRIRDFTHDYVLVMNSDLFTNIDFEDFFSTFSGESADACIATIPYNVDIPYAVLNVGEDSFLTGLREKPRYTYNANAGIYLFKKELIRLLPDGQKTDATDFIMSMIRENCRIIKYPIIGYWIDIGKPEDLQKANDFTKHLK